MHHLLPYSDSCLYWCLAYIREGISDLRIYVAVTSPYPPGSGRYTFQSFKHRRTVNTHVNIPCKLLSPPVLVDSTRFSLYTITEVSRKLKHTHFTSWFQNNTFCAQFSPDESTRVIDHDIYDWEIEVNRLNTDCLFTCELQWHSERIVVMSRSQ